MKDNAESDKAENIAHSHDLACTLKDPHSIAVHASLRDRARRHRGRLPPAQAASDAAAERELRGTNFTFLLRCCFLIGLGLRAAPVTDLPVIASVGQSFVLWMGSSRQRPTLFS
ncbi:hypothetical protein Y032_0252g212 [Ancylostoma ceylanicum]|uniref:Uncharacterized protein n=1 Tax=Ancylostoma ceylanicum TaxID=53326 RepID=A0A016SBR1_9BILA|nr:hypothetical protein Y032_0252g212 [Ancylostoma ceylanicum]